MITDLIRRVIGSPAERLIKKMQPNVVRINDLEARFKPMTDEALRACSAFPISGWAKFLLRRSNWWREQARQTKPN